ncbi:hypothetical protein P700755_000733 [Psychroflexus torquis ATCC 700755]|uniref:Uncharacterized protein n=1 Tax=Psychroflexus torquis (strain ATCC 700755 / CIP 106069 / ACAM 623) TaxID=313595 RepID=K4ICY5_PSYTT|nr:hypothetical protein [Psychroflexus torquis]AFU67738.1 hypothetical protein P700755_000733 [Psychroflexus torquis ATCC 700755]
MRKLINIFIILSLSISANSQEIEIGTIFTIEFSNPIKNMNFELISKSSYNGTIELSKMDSIIKIKPKENQIIGVFANGKFGNKTNSMLVLISGLNNNLNYDLKIKIPNKKKFQKTSTSALFKGVKSIEYWPYQIEEIDFKKFKTIPKENFEQFQIETKIDSTCIKNTDKNIEFGEKEFKNHFEILISELHNSEDFELTKMTEYENSINSEDFSLGHFWSLGEGIYPNEKRFKFDNPISYRRIECPYFEGKSTYFYTKNDKNIKVASFNWKTFKKTNFGANPKIEKDLENKFNEKFEFVLKTLNDILGFPIQNVTEESGRRKIRWKNEQGINAYMFNFSSNREIRLYVYKE